MGTKHGLIARAAGRMAVVALVAGLAAAAGPGAGVASAQAPEPPPDRQPTFLWLLTADNNGSVRFANLTCDPAGGSHPEAGAACRDLAAARGDFTKLPGEGPGIACPDVYAPVTVVAFGVWRGASVSYNAEYGNACELAVATGPVFQL
jgi:hypothetical protein